MKPWRRSSWEPSARSRAGRSAARSVATLGRSLDARIIGGGRREGPRLKELAVSSSSYGRPLAALYGNVRASGNGDLGDRPARTERDQRRARARPRPPATAIRFPSPSPCRAPRSTGSAGSGPTATSCAARRAISRPAAACAFTPAHGDQRPDPLMAAALGERCPAHRGLRLCRVRGSRARGLRQPHPRAELRGLRRSGDPSWSRARWRRRRSPRRAPQSRNSPASSTRAARSPSCWRRSTGSHRSLR